MKKVLLFVAMLCLVAVAAVAQTRVPPTNPATQAPEIDPNMVVGSVAALAGGLTVLRHYRRRT